ncbi:hypothetical protein [Fischerella thermalis]|nr:hypothetical protein [Fischerella thermalis]
MVSNSVTHLHQLCLAIALVAKAISDLPGFFQGGELPHTWYA